jgi:hypothetical protein
MMDNLSRRKLLRTASLIGGVSIVAGFPKLFPPAHAAGDPPRSTKASMKHVSTSKKTKGQTNKGQTNKGQNK